MQRVMILEYGTGRLQLAALIAFRVCRFPMHRLTILDVIKSTPQSGGEDSVSND